MTKEKQDGTAGAPQSGGKLDWIKFLRGQRGAAAATEAAGVSGESATGHRAGSTIEVLAQSSENSTGTPIDSGAVVRSDAQTGAAGMSDCPAGVFVTSLVGTAPQIITAEKDDWNDKEAAELSDYMHYTLCENYLRSCERAGYGKRDLDCGTRLQLAAAAAGVEISLLGGKELLPSLSGLTESLQKTEGYVENLNAQKLNDPVIYARVERDSKKIAENINRDLANIPLFYRKMAGAAEEIRAIRKMQHDYEKNGQLSDELLVNRKIAAMHRHAIDYIKDYEEKELRHSIETGNFARTMSGVGGQSGSGGL